jgi:hypothetical protein
VIRHPVDWIVSHEALVRAAEKHPRLYQIYLDDVFPQVLRQFPELYLMKCPDVRAFLAFANSCHGVNNLLFDMCYPGVRHLQMEVLTTRAEVLGEFCRDLTGLDYPPATLEKFIALGAINRHRPGKGRPLPHETYAAWQPWQQDMAHMMISGLVLDWLETMGYDLPMFREKASAGPLALPSGDAPCLADCLRSLDQRHPLLAHMTPLGATRAQIVETDLRGFRMARHQGKVYALANSIEIDDLAKMDEETLADLHEDGLCLVGATLGEVWRAIARVLADSPTLIEEYRGYNLINFREVCYAAPKGLALNLERMRSRERKQLKRENKLLAGATIQNVKHHIDALMEPREDQVYHAFASQK